MEIETAIIQIMADVGAMPKDQRNEMQNYNYRGIDGVYAELQPALIKNHVLIIPVLMEKHAEERQTKKGCLLIYTTVTVQYQLIHTGDSSKITCTVPGEGMDSSDKSTNKAMTSAYKNMIFQILCVPTKENKDSENDSHEPTPKATKADVKEAFGGDETKPYGGQAPYSKPMSGTMSDPQKNAIIKIGLQQGATEQVTLQCMTWYAGQKGEEDVSKQSASEMIKEFKQIYKDYKGTL